MGWRFAPSLGSGGGPSLSAVIVHHRGRADLHRCVAALRAEGVPEIVVVDNGSADRGAVSLPAGADLVRIRLPHNLGFAAGANLGLQAATGERLLLLNPDAWPEEGAVAAMCAVDADFVVPRILLADDPSHLDNCGHDLFPDGLNLGRGRGQPAAGRFESGGDVLLFSGAAVLARREALRATGLFDPGYWAYGEDADLGLRAARLGLRCRYVPDAVFHHRVGGAFGRMSARKAYFVERNRVRVALVHLPWSWLLLSPLWTVARQATLLAAWSEGVGDGGGPFVPAAAVAGQLAGLAGLGGSLRRRWSLPSPAPDYGARLRGARVGLGALRARRG